MSPVNRTKQRLYWRSIHASMNIEKIRSFFGSFSLNVLLLNQDPLTFLVEVRTNLKSFSYSTCDKNWNREIVLPTDQQSIATCTSYSFLHATTVSLIKLIFCMKNKKAADLKLQQRISKKSSFSRYLENAKFRNVLM